MGKLTASEARREASRYKRYIDNIIYQAGKNFEDMDFENANRRDEMEEIVNQIKNDCELAISSLENLYFEE